METLQEYYAKLVNDYVREIRAMVSLEGLTNIVSIEDYAIEPQESMVGSRIYIRMEFLQSFPEYSSSHKLTQEDAVKLGIDMCTALSYCEQINLVHRDIKPDNIFVSKHGDFKLGDFGIAGLSDNRTRNFSLKGTYTYMAPEIFRDQVYNASTDLYSLGLVLYRLVNNNRDAFINPMKQLVYSRDREEALQRRLRGDPLPRPCNCSDELNSVIQKACAYRPEDRYASAGEMREALLAIGEKQSDDHKLAASKNERSQKSRPSNRKAQPIRVILMSLLAVGAVFACFVFGYFLINKRGSEAVPDSESGSKKEQKEENPLSAELASLTDFMEANPQETTQIDGYRRIIWDMKPDEAKKLLMFDGATCTAESSAEGEVLKAVTEDTEEHILLEECFFYSENQELKEVDSVVRLLPEQKKGNSAESSPDLFYTTVELLKLFYGEPVRKETSSGKQMAGWFDKDGDLIVVYTSENQASEVNIFAGHESLSRPEE